MRARESTLGELLEGSCQFVVPSFQPTYHWTFERRDTFIEGILQAFRTHPEHDIFYGAVVLLPIESGPDGLEKSLIVDGYQRLITMLALLAALGDAAATRDRELPVRIRSRWLLNSRFEGHHRFKVLPGERDRSPFFEALAESCDSLTAFEPARHFLDRIAQERDLDESGFLEFLTRRLRVVRIDLEKNENPYPIFISLHSSESPVPPPGAERYLSFADDPELMALVAIGESDQLEFKESITVRDGREPDIERQGSTVVRAVAGFMNSSSGGTLLIGVSDDGSIRGVNREYRLVDRGKGNWDGYVLTVRNMLRTRLGIENAFRFYTVRRHTVAGRDVCRLDVRPADAPVYVNKRLFLRSGNQTIEVRGPDLVDYVGRRWPAPTEDAEEETA